MKTRASIFGVLSLMPIAAFGSGADLLLQTVGGSGSAVQGPQPGITQVQPSYQINDPFTAQLHSFVQVTQAGSPVLRDWYVDVLSGKLEQSAHRWSVAQKVLTESHRFAAQSAYAYALWKLDLPRTFFSQWAQMISEPAYLKSPFSIALEQTFSPGIESKLEALALVLEPEQEQAILKLDPGRGQHVAVLQAWILSRKSIQGKTVLESLAAKTQLRLRLAETVAWGLAQRKDLAQAARVLKDHAEPALKEIQDPHAVSRYFLQLARLLYQAGAYEGAESYYEKIPAGSPEYLKAREELTWVWLRMGDNQKLRGALSTLALPIFKEQFAPEIELVSAVTNLKLCFYDAVQKDLDRFMEKNRSFARQIQSALSAEIVPPGPEKDYFSELAERSLAALQSEHARLNVFAERSIESALPAVGRQAHWERSAQALERSIELSKKRLQAEYRRQWKNRAHALQEAIRKMKFVKVEYLSQLRMLARKAPAPSVPVAAQQDSIRVSSASSVRRDEGEIVFPFDGVIWNDELFRLRSLAQSRCLERSAAQ
jgi:tetratricopeptide (TPR) repeat protein